eukprot:COSAG01_NODE_5610_length_4147_cov_332.779150_1_plen_151_part_10
MAVTHKLGVRADDNLTLVVLARVAWDRGIRVLVPRLDVRRVHAHIFEPVCFDVTGLVLGPADALDELLLGKVAQPVAGVDSVLALEGAGAPEGPAVACAPVTARSRSVREDHRARDRVWRCWEREGGREGGGGGGGGGGGRRGPPGPLGGR